MVTLPQNWLDYVLVDTTTNALLLYLMNSTGQFIVHRHQMDKAFTLQENIDKFVQTDLSSHKAWVWGQTAPAAVEPSTQDWHPVPIPLEGVVTLKQFEEMAKV